MCVIVVLNLPKRESNKNTYKDPNEKRSKNPVKNPHQNHYNFEYKNFN